MAPGLLDALRKTERKEPSLSFQERKTQDKRTKIGKCSRLKDCIFYAYIKEPEPLIFF